MDSKIKEIAEMPTDELKKIPIEDIIRVFAREFIAIRERFGDEGEIDLKVDG